MTAAFILSVTFLPALYIRSEIPTESEVVTRSLRTRPPSRTIGMIWRRHSARSEEFAALAGLLRGLIKARLPEVTVLS